jgi:hypothetical protein
VRVLHNHLIIFLTAIQKRAVDGRYRSGKWHHFLPKKKCFGHYDQPEVESLREQSGSGATQLLGKFPRGRRVHRH